MNFARYLAPAAAASTTPGAPRSGRPIKYSVSSEIFDNAPSFVRCVVTAHGLKNAPANDAIEKALRVLALLGPAYLLALKCILHKLMQARESVLKIRPEDVQTLTHLVLSLRGAGGNMRIFRRAVRVVLARRAIVVRGGQPIRQS